MNILFTICARAGSKGIAGKNVKYFCGRPLVFYTLEIYEKYLKKYSGNQAKINLAVNTDSEKLLQQICNKNTDFILIERDDSLAGDIVAKGDVIQDTWMKAEKFIQCEYDLVVDLDITSPLRTLEDVVGTISKVMLNEKCNFAYSVVESRRSPYFNMVCKNANGFFDRVIRSDYTARQQAPECFDMNASIYVYARNYLLDMREENRFALVWKMQDSVVLDIDNEKDFEIMEILARYYWKKGKYLDIRGYEGRNTIDSPAKK